MSRRSYITLGAVLAFLLLFNLVFIVYSPEKMVELIGVQNSYVAVFLIAAFGGLNTFTSGVLYASIATFAAGGASPWLLGVAGGAGIAIGDVIMFTLFRTGVRSVSGVWRERVLWVREKVLRLPQWLQYVVVYLYLGFSPLPNDVLMFLLATVGYAYRVLVPLLLLGGITIATVTALLGGWF